MISTNQMRNWYESTDIILWDDNRRRIAGVAGCGFYEEASNPLTGSKGKPPDFGKNGCCFSSLKKRIESK
ncbi:protein of unknown function [Ruminococcaceae bacterium BL-6]|nr:protein of unknown function [Ruminococcaceae bacterium BL-6]